MFLYRLYLYRLMEDYLARTGSFIVEARLPDGTPTDDFAVQCLSIRNDGERVFAAWNPKPYESKAYGFWIVTAADTTKLYITNLVEGDYTKAITVIVTFYSDYGVPFPQQYFQTIRYQQTAELDLRRFLI